ncbi:MAG: IS91 family transposase [Paludibacteraceae bacterium]|nr:IS91 family transposase [Paludibacteraceae bacterium]
MNQQASNPELADIFIKYKSEYLQTHKLSEQEQKAYKAITSCRTAELGGHRDVCLNCGSVRQSYNSCRNRHCPKCQHAAKIRWLNAREKEALPVKYFHLVFTLPHSLNSIVINNKALLYDLLFKSVFYTVSKFARDPRWLGAQPGGMAILHTWGQNLSFHPHLHLVLAAGGLSEDEMEWIFTHSRYFASVKAMSAVFKGCFMQQLKKLIQKPDFRTVENQQQLLADTEAKKWVVYAQAPFSSPKHVIAYLGNYTHRIAISNSRVVKIQDNRVHFKIKNYRNKGKQQVISLPALEFIRRFLQHVLPQRFYKIRYFGFSANRQRSHKHEKAIDALAREGKHKAPQEPQTTEHPIIRRLSTYFKPCKHCGSIMVPEIWADKINLPKQINDS